MKYIMIFILLFIVSTTQAVPEKKYTISHKQFLKLDKKKQLEYVKLVQEIRREMWIQKQKDKLQKYNKNTKTQKSSWLQNLIISFAYANDKPNIFQPCPHKKYGIESNRLCAQEVYGKNLSGEVFCVKPTSIAKDKIAEIILGEDTKDKIAKIILDEENRDKIAEIILHDQACDKLSRLQGGAEAQRQLLVKTPTTYQEYNRDIKDFCQKNPNNVRCMSIEQYYKHVEGIIQREMGPDNGFGK